MIQLLLQPVSVEMMAPRDVFAHPAQLCFHGYRLTVYTVILLQSNADGSLSKSVGVTFRDSKSLHGQHMETT